MAEAEYYTGTSVQVQTVWGKSPLGTLYSRKWKKTTRRTATVRVGIASKDAADAIAEGFAAYNNVEDVSTTLEAGGLWKVSGTIVEVEWESLGDFIKGTT